MEFRDVVRIARGLRPALHVHLQRQVAAGIALQIDRKIGPVRRGIGRADDEIPEIEVGRTLDRPVKRKDILFEADRCGQRRDSLRGARLAPRHGGSLAGPDQNRRVARVPVRGRLAMEYDPPARRIVDRRHRHPLHRQFQRPPGRQALDLRQGNPHAGGNRLQADSIDPLIPHQHLQHVRRTGHDRLRFSRRGRHRPWLLFHGGRWPEHHRKRPQVAHLARQLDLFHSIGGATPIGGRRIHHRVGRIGLEHPRRHQGLVQLPLHPRCRIDAIHTESRRSPTRPQSPRHPPLGPRPFAPHLRHLRAKTGRLRWTIANRLVPRNRRRTRLDQAGHAKAQPSPHPDRMPLALHLVRSVSHLSNHPAC
jgi:hypothetical protein